MSGFANYDAWLEAPYQERYAQDDLYEEYADECAENGEEPDEGGFQDWLEERREAAEERAADLAYDAARERDWDFD